MNTKSVWWDSCGLVDSEKKPELVAFAASIQSTSAHRMHQGAWMLPQLLPNSAYL